MDRLKKVASMVEQLRTFSSSKDADKAAAKTLLSQMKIELLSFKLIPPFEEDQKVARHQLQLARQTFEIAALLAVRWKDYEMFERHVAQLKPFYYDYTEIIPASDLQWPILGLSLLALLVSDRLSEFHTEVELIPLSHHNDKYVQFAIQLEQELMEGSYNKVLASSKHLPLPEYSFFVEDLVETVRDKIASCSERAYESLSLNDAQRLLMLKSPQDTQAYCEQRKWRLQDNVFQFPQSEDRSLDIPANKVITQTLHYATELERIV